MIGRKKIPELFHGSERNARSIFKVYLRCEGANFLFKSEHFATRNE